MSGPKVVQFQYTDLLGFLRGVEVLYDPANGSEFPASFDGSSVGMANVEESDLLLRPLLYSLKQVPWAQELWRVLSTVHKPNKERHPLDPRLAAERALQYARSLGYEPVLGAELEFFLVEEVKVEVFNNYSGYGVQIRSKESPASGRAYFGMAKFSYHSVEPMDSLLTFRLEYSKALRHLGYSCEVAHHEVAISQVESSLGAGDPPFVADEIVTAKWAARNVARQLGLTAVFLPKPFYGDNGSGMHLHLSLWSNGRNLFSDGGLTQTARYFIGGILEHASSLAAIVAPTTNSYRRLVPGYEAPVYKTWGFYNRTAVVRVPAATSERRTRVEFRAPDPTANPYLAVAATLLAGLDGIAKKIDPGEPYAGNAYRLSDEERRRLGIGTLPASLKEALEELESDNEYLRPAFGRELLERYMELKRREVKEVEMRPHPYEYYLYLNL